MKLTMKKKREKKRRKQKNHTKNENKLFVWMIVAVGGSMSFVCQFYVKTTRRAELFPFASQPNMNRSNNEMKRNENEKKIKF